MNKPIQALLIISVLSLDACNTNHDTLDEQEKAVKEIEQAEKDFESMAKEKGIAEAFWYFADSNAVIKRGNDSLIQGKSEIRNFYSDPYFESASVTWSPDFVEASSNGDMGYTYGKYLWQSKDSTGKDQNYQGVFHTVWKKQADGSWKYVWD